MGKVVQSLIAAALAALSLSACENDRRELVSARSPDGRVNAVLHLEMGGGAAGWVHHSLYLLEDADDPKRADEKFAAPRLVAYRMEEPSLHWEGRVLHVSYTRGEIGKFIGSWYPKHRASDAHKVEIRLEPKCGGKCI